MEGRGLYYLGNGYYHDTQTNHYYRDMRAVNNNRRQRNSPSQNQPKEEESGKGFGYFLAAAVGFVAAYFAKNYLAGLEEETERPKSDQREFSRGDSRQYQNAEPINKPVDPADAELEECTDVVCPITLELMNDPVISKKCGHSFENEAINRWLRSKDYCPKCHVNLQQSDLVKNYSLKNAIEYMRKQIKNKEPKQ